MLLGTDAPFPLGEVEPGALVEAACREDVGVRERFCRATPDGCSRVAFGDGATTSVALSISDNAWLHSDSARPVCPAASSSRMATMRSRSFCS